jgi:hypothetical protein
MADGRYALLVATSNYTDERLRVLSAPTNDAKDLAAVLKNREIGRFDVKIVTNKPTHTVLREIEQFFSDRAREDMLVLYFSGHGVKDDAGKLYLAAPNTRRGLLRSTAISDEFVRDVMAASRARLQVLILDCCFGGAFSRALLAKGDGTVDVAGHFLKQGQGGVQGQGCVILTASTAMEFAFEDEAEQEQRRSVFTRMIVDGLRSGEADMDGDRRVSVQDLYTYAYQRVALPGSRQTPTITSIEQAGSIYLADVPASAARRPAAQPLAATGGPARRLDLRPWVKIRDQGNEGANPAVAAVTALEAFLALRGQAVRLSPRYVYQKAKQLQGVEQSADIGIHMEVLAEVLQKHGAPPEEDWPYEPGRWKLPDGTRWAELDHRAEKYRARLIPATLYDEIPHHLSHGRPVLAAFEVFQSTWFAPRADKPGWITAPTLGDPPIGMVATTIIDFDEEAQALTFAHTWGLRWGDHGFGSMTLEAAQAMFKEEEMWAVEVRGRAPFAWSSPPILPVAAPEALAPAGEEPTTAAPERRRRHTPAPRRARAVPADHQELRRAVYDAQHEAADWSQPTLPESALARGEGDAPTGDPAVDETYEALGAFYRFLREAYGRNSYDGGGAPLEAVVHYGREYLNSFWDGRRVILGAGDGKLFNGFHSLDVVAKECSNGLVQSESELPYERQSGALFQSLSCVFATLVKQHHNGQTTDEADWLIGKELLGPDVRGIALLSMVEPGSAYDDPMLGKDPQVGHMSSYVTAAVDYGGVHINCGIPNRAFALAALSLGGHAWERAGRVWYEALRRRGTSRLGPRMTFRKFAGRTVSLAEQVFPKERRVVEAIRDAWFEVGVEFD